MWAVDAKHVTKIFPASMFLRLSRHRGFSKELAALKSISLSVKPGEILCVAGANGSGKTTLLDVLAARCPPTEGSVQVFGHDVKRERAMVRELVRHVSCDRLKLNPRVSGLSNLMTVAQPKGAQDSDLKSRIEEAVESLALSEVISEPVATYSAGMRYRLAVARGVLAAPKVLAIDDLFCGLDTGVRRGVRTLLRRWVHECGGTVIFTARRTEDARDLADSVAILEEGRVKVLGPAPVVLPPEPPAEFSLHIRGPSEVVLSAQGTGGGVLGEGAREDIVTIDVKAQGDSAFLRLLGQLLRHDYPDPSKSLSSGVGGGDTS